MTKFIYHTKQSAPEASQPWLSGGFIPNLSAVMAEAPGLLGGYKTLWEMFAKTSLSPVEQQVVYMTANFENNCEYCVPWHTYLMKSGKMPDEVIEALRKGEVIPEEKLEALHQFTEALIETRGHAGDEALEAFIEAGYSQQQALEVILGLAVKLMSNYTNAIAHTELDAPPQQYAWSKPETHK